MNVYSLTGHSHFCKCNKNTDENDNKYIQNWFGRDTVMECNLSHFIFFLNGQYNIVNYYQCLNFPNETDFRKNILNKVCNNIKETKNIYSNIQTGIRFNDRLKAEIKKGQITKLYAIEVVYTYGYSGEFCITNKIPISDMIGYSSCMKDSYNKAVKFIKDTFLDDIFREKLIEVVGFYRIQNEIYLNETKIVSTVDQLVKQINLKINQK